MRRLIVLGTLMVLGGCTSPAPPDRFAEAKAIISSRCGSCHVVPGVSGAHGNVGPSLAGIGNRQVLAGYFKNDRATMIRWITQPQAMLPRNAMPNTGLTPRQANLVADYLYTLDN